MLEPACLRMTVPQAYRDHNGHMNMRWYSAIFDEAGDTLRARIGLTAEYNRLHRTGTLDLEHHVHFLNEVNAGDTIAVVYPVRRTILETHALPDVHAQ